MTINFKLQAMKALKELNAAIDLAARINDWTIVARLLLARERIYAKAYAMSWDVETLFVWRKWAWQGDALCELKV
jgi:hypothetical protein